MHSRSVRVAQIAALAIAALGASATEPAAVNPAVREAATARIKARMAQVKAAQTKLAPKAADSVDTTPAVLTAFNATPAVDVNTPGIEMVVSFKASDDLSGASSVRAWAWGPVGQLVEVGADEILPSTKLTAKMRSNGLSPFLAPGEYRFVSASIHDHAGNYRTFDENELARLGQTSFTVKNKKGYDSVGPSLESGKVLTPQISLSAQHPGTNGAAFAQLTVVATDSGQSAVSGVHHAEALFCMDYAHCFRLTSSAAQTVPLAASGTLKVGGQPFYYASVTGDYRLATLTLFDYAGNMASYESIEFGGQIDFSTYFPSSTITLVP
jgi:hypothetical protein